MSKQIHQESDRKQQVKFRASETLVEQFDEEITDSRAATLRELMQSVVDGDLGDDDQLQPPADDETLAAGYEVLCKVSGGGSIPVREAKSIVASKTNIPKDAVARRVLKPLQDRGYISRTGDPFNDPWLVVR